MSYRYGLVFCAILFILSLRAKRVSYLSYMMRYGYSGMMAGTGLLALLTWMVLLVDLVLLGVFLWKKAMK